jgi:hypothetical protein
MFDNAETGQVPGAAPPRSSFTRIHGRAGGNGREIDAAAYSCSLSVSVCFLPCVLQVCECG